MGLFDWIKSKPAPKPAVAIPIEYQTLIESTRVPYAVIREGQPIEDVRASKFGGIPYRPERGAYDTLLARDEMSFVAQIRCDELPELPAFPRTGLIQFWVVRRDLMTGVGERADGRVCLYYPSTEAPQLVDWAPSFDMEDSPLHDPDRATRIHFSADTELMPAGDYQWRALLEQSGLLANHPALVHLRHERYATTGHRVGGYCAFTQVDPRTPGDPMISLLQLDSEDPTAWGDAGIAHWFLREADLRACAFDKTLFYWDCC